MRKIQGTSKQKDSYPRCIILRTDLRSPETTHSCLCRCWISVWTCPHGYLPVPIDHTELDHLPPCYGDIVLLYPCPLVLHNGESTWAENTIAVIIAIFLKSLLWFGWKSIFPLRSNWTEPVPELGSLLPGPGSTSQRAGLEAEDGKGKGCGPGPSSLLKPVERP